MSQKVMPIDAATRASRKTDKSTQTRRSLVREALRVISEKGLESTSVLEIAQQLRISHGTFYYHFQNMDHLLEEVGHSVVNSLIEKIGSVQRDDPAAQIARGPLIIFHYAQEHPQLQPIMLRVVLDVEGRHADIKDGVRNDILLGRRLERFIVDDVDLSAEFCASLVGAMLRLTKGSEDAKRIAFLTTVDTLVLLGVPRPDAQAVVEQERSALKDELTNLDSEVLAG